MSSLFFCSGHIGTFTFYQWDSRVVLTLRLIICLSGDLMATSAFRNDCSRPDEGLVALCVLTDRGNGRLLST